MPEAPPFVDRLKAGFTYTCLTARSARLCYRCDDKAEWTRLESSYPLSDDE